ncbi:MAG: type II secretion system protein [Campylobacterota bacterium]
MRKRAFTLTELILVIVLVSVIYMLAFSNLSLFNSSSKIKLSNLKSYLKKQSFENSLKLICLENKEECVIYLDNKPTKKIQNPFGKILSVYKNDENRKRVYFDDIKLDKFYERVSLNLYLDKKGLHNNYIVQNEDNYIVLDSLKSSFFAYENLNDYLQQKEKNIAEVKNAF